MIDIMLDFAKDGERKMDRIKTILSFIVSVLLLILLILLAVWGIVAVGGAIAAAL